MNEGIFTSLKQLFRECFRQDAESIAPMPVSGSNRHYFRITGNGVSAIGVYNTDAKENRAFVSFTNHFRSKGPYEFGTHCIEGAGLGGKHRSAVVPSSHAQGAVRQRKGS